MRNVLRELLTKPGFEDLNEKVQQRGMVNRYKIHIYSFKKFAFTVMADTLGEIAARAVKGDKEYVLTYYRKSRDERVSDYRKVIPKLTVFDYDSTDKAMVKQKLKDELYFMSEDEQRRLLDSIKGNKRAKGSSCQTKQKN